MDAQIANVYSQGGGDLPYFTGKQYGSGWLRTLGRMAFPILKRLGSVAANTVSDVMLDDKPMAESLVSNAVKEYNKAVPTPRRRLPINTSKKRPRAKSTSLPVFYSKRARK